MQIERRPRSGDAKPANRPKRRLRKRCNGSVRELSARTRGPESNLEGWHSDPGNPPRRARRTTAPATRKSGQAHSTRAKQRKGRRIRGALDKGGLNIEVVEERSA